MSSTTLVFRRFIRACSGLLLIAVCSPAFAGYWTGVSRSLPVSPLGNTVALSCHNCYGTTNAATTTQVSMALNRGSTSWSST